MEAVVYSNFRNNLKHYMKKVNDEYEPLMVVNKNPDENIVVLSKKNWDSIQETIRLMNNEYLSDKVLSGEDIKRNPFEGIGKPEPLKYRYSGAWSRRITDEQRLVYMVEKDEIYFLSFRDHYT